MADFIKVTDTGLQVATRSQIYDQLAVFAKAAYGEDISLEEGTPFDVFLQMLADGLSTVNGATQTLVNMFSSKVSSGNMLDFVVGQRGIKRKRRGNQRVVMTVTLNEDGQDAIKRPFLASRNTITICDCLGRKWRNSTQLTIQEKKFLPDGDFDEVQNYQGTCEFLLIDGDYDSNTLFANNYVLTEIDPDNPPKVVDVNGNTVNAPCKGQPLMAISPSDQIFGKYFEFNNAVNATPAVAETETDAQLRARFDLAAYSDAASTVEGLRSNLLKLCDYVRIVENVTNSSDISENNPYGLEAHSIWVIVDGGSKSANYDGTDATVSKQSNDITVAQNILNYKSLGCGVSLAKNADDYLVPNGHITINGEEFNTGNFMVEIPIETIIAQIPFTRMINSTVTFFLNIETESEDGFVRSSVAEMISLALQSYVGGLQPGEPVTTIGIVTAVKSVTDKYDTGVFDFGSVLVFYGIGTPTGTWTKGSGENYTFVWKTSSTTQDTYSVTRNTTSGNLTFTKGSTTTTYELVEYAKDATNPICGMYNDPVNNVMLNVTSDGTFEASDGSGIQIYQKAVGGAASVKYIRSLG